MAVLLGGVIRPRSRSPPAWAFSPTSGPARWPRWYVEQGFGTLKTKAGADMHEDLEMVRGIRDAVGDKLKLRIDPNRAYSPQQAAELARRLEQYDLEYFEQPIPAEPLADAAWLRRQTPRADRANESVTGPASVLEILASRRRRVHPARHAHRRRHPALRHDRPHLRGGRHSLHHALRPRPGPEDGRHAARRRRLPRLFAGQRHHLLRPGRRHHHRAADDRARHDGRARRSPASGDRVRLRERIARYRGRLLIEHRLLTCLDADDHAEKPTNVRWAIFGLACGTSWLLYLHRYTFALIKPRAGQASGTWTKSSWACSTAPSR